jgi:hypothetical protein
MAKMNIADKFEKDIERCLPLLSEDEWALAKARENITEQLSPNAAFSEIPAVLELAKKQTDNYAFTSCIWLALDLARKADTTERPKDLEKSLMELKEYASKFGASFVLEVRKLAEWYRISNTI